MGQHVALKGRQGLSTSLPRPRAARAAQTCPEGPFPASRAQRCPFLNYSHPAWRTRGTLWGTRILPFPWPCSNLPFPDGAKPILQLPPPTASDSQGCWCLIRAVLPQNTVPGRETCPAAGRKTNPGVPRSHGHPRRTGGVRLAGPALPL